MTQRFAGLILAVGLLAFMAPVRAGAAAESEPAVAGLDVDKTAFDALSEGDRRAVQDALTWTGDFSGTASGVYGPRTREALAAFKARVGLPPSALDNALRDRLLRAGDQARKDVGFAVVNDVRTGLRIGLPLKLLPKQAATASGTRYSGPDGAVDVDTVARPAGEGGLAEVFARMSVTGPSRTVTYKLSRPDFFVVSGDANDRKFYSRFAIGAAGETSTIRGFTISYPKAAAKKLDPVALAVAGSFAPFPDVATPPAPAAKLPSSSPAPAAEAVLVAPGVVLAKLSRADCPAPSVDGVAASWRKEDAPLGLAILDLPTPGGAPVPFAAATTADEVLALFHAEPRGAPRPGLLAASSDLRAGDSRPYAFSIALPLQGEGGAVLVDASGALVGLVVPRGTPSLTVAGTVLEARYDVVDAATLAAFVKGAVAVTVPTAPSPPRAFAQLARALERSVLAVGCAAPSPAAP